MHAPIRITQVLKIILINVLILFFCLSLIELFFIINSKYKFISRPPFHLNKAQDLNLKKVEDKYGSSIFLIPDQYKTVFDSRLENITDAQVNYFSMAPLYDVLGGKSTPGTVQVQTRLLPPNDDIVLSDAEYKIDKYRRRIVENQKNKTKPTKYMLALGDSMTLGAGVTSGHDYPSLLAKKISPDIKVYNFGKPGFGPNDLLLQLQTKPDVMGEVSQKEGLAIWLFIDSQFERFFCDFICYQKDYDQFIFHKPKYELDNDKLVNLGPFSQNWNFKKKLLYYLAQSETIKFSRFKFKYSDEQMRTLVTGFKEIKTILEQKKNLKKFYVLFPHPFEEKEQLAQLLENENINTIDISDIPFKSMKNMRIPFDRHPTSGQYWIITEILKKYIEI